MHRRTDRLLLAFGCRLTVSAEPQPRNSVAAQTVQSSRKENSPKQSICCPVSSGAHSLSTRTTKAAQPILASWGTEQQSKTARSYRCLRHLHKTGQGLSLCIRHRSTCGSMEGQALHAAELIKDMECRCMYYVNQK